MHGVNDIFNDLYTNDLYTSNRNMHDRKTHQACDLHVP